MKEIYLYGGLITQVSDVDFLYLLNWNWHPLKNGNTYYVRRHQRINGKLITTTMHQQIISERMGLTVPKGYVRDHEDRNGLNNQRYNLRIVTHSINSFNHKLCETNISGYRGIHWHKNRNKWEASIYNEGVQIHLGSYNNIDDAIKIRQEAEIKYYGEIIV